MRIVYILGFCLFASPCFCEAIDSNFKLSATKSVAVVLLDDAKDGCWTNLRETREYAEEKLRSKGAKVVPEEGYLPNSYSFLINVLSYRTTSGCAASIGVTLETPSLVKNSNGDTIIHFGIASRDGTLITGYDKANNEVLNVVKRVIDKLN